ncbi:molybdopterin molybdenumtransferase MoeA [Roseovarius spongiae]|uniref:Molybdopterin molybdenumtransferase n=1 Tax=Roseovarius spongiae TaxID=2320272 RepID=A0A3A8ASW9_9RHOB|nr:gephyrin-like molybdotransferase Glp [Roseovarius spongiae]RKF14629.1 molybdopterin molybdenumtransferase MoeA [Roseovarius spongiae]
MRGFDSVLVTDWSAASAPAPKRPSKDAIWIGLSRDGVEHEPLYCRTRHEAEARLATLIDEERAAGRRLLAAFDFPFGYPAGFARRVTGSDDPLALWDWLETRIEDDESGRNNRFEVAETLNALFDGPGPFWGKTHRDRWPGIPYAKRGVSFDAVAEKRACDRAARAASSCFQLCYHPTVGSQALMGLPMLARLRRRPGVAVWPFGDWQDAPVVLAECWPGLIERAVRHAQTGGEEIRDRAQVRLLARALARLPVPELQAMMTGLPPEAREEAWILAAGHGPRLCALAADDAPLDPPPLRDDCFALPAGVHWTPVDEALTALRAGLHRVVGAENLPLDAAAGRVLAEDVRARRSNPPAPNSAVDGYGFAFASLPDSPHHVLPLCDGRAAAGSAYRGAVPPGHALRILTGAIIPEGVDTVVLEEDVRRDARRIAFRSGVRKGANTRKAGEDVMADEAIAAKGRVLTPADLALLAATGTAEVRVYRRLRVAILSTGDEIRAPGEATLPEHIHDANRPMLGALMAGMGIDVVDIGRIPDDREALRAALDRAALEADAILTSGGASAGDEDHVSALLREAGAMRTWRIALKPGRPLALALWEGKPVFGLPGNPVAALVCTLIFARPALATLAGAAWTEPQGFDVPAAFAKRKKPGRREYLRARIRGGRAEVFGSEGSGRVSGLSWAEGLVELPDGAAEIAPGDPVRYIPFTSFGL